jgi:hypothetical protein
MSTSVSTTTESTRTDPGSGEVHWAIEGVSRFWTAPAPERVALFAEDGVSHWPGQSEPARGRTGHQERIASIVELIPDIQIELKEYAADGDFLFFRWVARGTGKKGPFEIGGVDRLRLNNEERQIAQTLVFFDTAHFEEVVGAKVPYA